MSEEIAAADSLMTENTQLRAQLAALVESCGALADFIQSYPPDSEVAYLLPAFYGIFRVYGKNARAAVNAVRPQADALLERLADLSRQIGELNTTIGYQDAMLAQRDAELTILRELASDVARWRETGGDPRDLRYILETADRIAQMKAGSA